MQHPVRIDPTGRHDRHRDEPACLAQLGAGIKATGFPIAKIAASSRSAYTSTRSQRHHAQDPGMLRADASTTSS